MLLAVKQHEIGICLTPMHAVCYTMCAMNRFSGQLANRKLAIQKTGQLANRESLWKASTYC